MKKLSALIFLLALLFAAQAGAANYWVRPTGTMAGCTPSATAPGANSGWKSTIAAGIGCLAAGDTLNVDAATYNETINTNSIVIPSGTGDATRTTIRSITSRTAILLPSSAGDVVNLVVGGVTSSLQYITVQGLVIDGSNATGGISAGAGGSNRIRFDDVEVKNVCGPTNCAGSGVFFADAGSFFEFLNGSVHDNGLVAFVPPAASYGFYVESDNVTISNTSIYNNGGYGIHTYDGNGSSNDNVYVGNAVYNNCTTYGDNGCAGILLYGNRHTAYNNLVYDNAQRGISCASNSDCKVYNNTIVGNGHWGLSASNSTAIFRNNILSGNSLGDFQDDGGNTLTRSNNRCDNAGTGCSTTASPGFVNAAGKNYSLTSASAMRNAGTTTIGGAVTACKNSANPDLGAIQTLGQPTAGVDGVNFTITFVNNCTSQMLPASSITGLSFRKLTVANAIVTNVRTGSNSFMGTLTNAFVAGNACDFSYAQAAGNVFSDNNIGNVTTSNQELFDFTNVACDNITGGSATVGLSHWRIYLLQGATDAAWVAKCPEDSANCVVAPGSKLWVRGKLRNNSGTAFSTFNLSHRWRYNAGAYAALTGSYVNGIRVLGTGTQLGIVISDASSITADKLTSDEATNVAGIAIRSTSSIPSLTLNDSTETEFAQAVDISPTAVIGDVYEACPFTDTGTALTCTTPIKITVGSPSGAR